jgi:hypothetical protein
VDEAERKQKYEQQTEEVYAAIGRFAVKFEHVCHAMYLAVMNLLQRHGLQNQRLANCVLDGLTAEPLRRMFAAAVAEVRGDQLVNDEKRIFNNIIKRIQQLTETRNNLIHRTWFVGWAAPTDEDFSSAPGWKFKNTGKGVEFCGLDYKREDFDSFSAQADELTGIINRLDGCLHLNRSFAENFVLDADGTVRLPRAS